MGFRDRPLTWGIGVLAALVLLVALVGCGGGSGGPPSATIGPEGGSLTSGDGRAALLIPPGALSSALAITVVEATGAPAGAVGRAYDLGPDGTPFAQPAQLTIQYDPAALPAGVPEADLRLGKAVGGAWQEVLGSTVDQGANTVAGALTSFSTYGVFSPTAPPPIPTADLIAYVVDEVPVGSTGYFTRLADATQYLCQNLKSGERGKVVVKTNRPLSVTTLTFNCAIDIEAEDGTQPTIEGTSVVINAGGPVSFIGFAFNAGSVTFNVDDDFILFTDSFSSAATVNIGGAGAAARGGRAGVSGTGRIGSCEFGGTVGLNTRLDYTGDLSITNIEAPGIEFGGEAYAAGSGRCTVSGGIVEEITGTASLKESFNLEYAGIGGVNLVNQTVRLGGGRPTYSMKDQVVAKGTVTLAGGGQLDFDLDRVTFNQKLDLTAPPMGDGSKLFLNWGATSTFNGGLSADVKTRLEGTWNDVTFGADAGVMTSSDATLEGTNVTLNGGLSLRHKIGEEGSAKAGVAFTHSIVKNGATVEFDPGVQFTAGLDNVDFVEGAAFLVRKALGGSPRASAKPRQATPPVEIAVRNSTFTGFTRPAVDIFAVTPDVAPSVTIENNTFDGSPWAVVLGEVNVPVTIRGNTIKGGGIGLDGDIEGEGTSGLLLPAYLVEGNTINVTAFGSTGVSVQDLQNVALHRNSVTATAMAAQGIAVSGGRATLVTNTLSVTGGLGLVVQGAVRPGVVRATDNQLGDIVLGANAFLNAKANVISGVIALSPGAYARLTGNKISGRIGDPPPGGLLNDPMDNSGLDPETDIGTQIDFDGNGCADYPPSNNVKDPDTGECGLEGTPIPSPALPAGFHF